MTHRSRYTDIIFPSMYKNVPTSAVQIIILSGMCQCNVFFFLKVHDSLFSKYYLFLSVSFFIIKIRFFEKKNWFLYSFHKLFFNIFWHNFFNYYQPIYVLIFRFYKFWHFIKKKFFNEICNNYRASKKHEWLGPRYVN